MKRYTLSEWWMVVNSCITVTEVLKAGAALVSMAEHYTPETFAFLHQMIAERKMQLLQWAS